MARTTVNIDGPILEDLKRLQREERKSLGRLISELVAEALALRRRGGETSVGLNWQSRPMQARVDLLDKEALRAALDKGAAE